MQYNVLTKILRLSYLLQKKKTATRASAFSQDFICFTLLLLVISFFSSNRVNIYY